jgi:hypothetical protein
VKPLLLMRSVDVINAVDSFGEGSGNYAEFPDKHSDIFKFLTVCMLPQLFF